MAAEYATCWNCAANLVPPTTATLFSHPITTSQDEITQIHEKTRRLEGLIQTLQKERDNLLRRLNELQSPGMRVPAEVLSIIFEIACCPREFILERDGKTRIGDRDLDHFQLTLAGVCSRWRQVAQSTPRLWTSIVLNIASHNEQQRGALLRLYLGFTTSLPLTLIFLFSTNSPIENTLLHPSVDGLIIQNLPRVRQLFLQRGSRKWLDHLSSLPQLVNCYLDLDHPRDHRKRETAAFTDSMLLRHFAIHDTNRRKILTVHAPWIRLTSLDLSEVQVGPAVQILLQCQNLVRFRFFSFATYATDGLPVTLVEPVTFKYLEDFAYTGLDCSWGRALIRFIRLPALKTLRIGRHEFPDSFDGLNDFFRRIPSSLSKAAIPYPSHLQLIPDTSNIEELSINFPRLQQIRLFLETLVQRVGSNSSWLNAWAKLKKLTLKVYIRGPSLEGQDGTLCGHLFLEAMENRKASGAAGFYLYVTSGAIQWAPMVEKGLKDGLDQKEKKTQDPNK